MPDNTPGYQRFFAELKRRRVFRVMAVYGAVAFVVLQVADILQDGLRLPESFLPIVTAISLLGFPVAVALAWAFDVTPGGLSDLGATRAFANIEYDPRWLPFLENLGMAPDQLAAIEFEVEIPE